MPIIYLIFLCRGPSNKDPLHKNFNTLKEMSRKMNHFDERQKSIEKAIRYIKQGAILEKLAEVQKLLEYVINKQIRTLEPVREKAVNE
jgi:NADH:ubiquinone oxidoreductase subunit E